MILFGILISMQDSKLDITIGPYETYEDKLFGYKVLGKYFIFSFIISFNIIFIILFYFLLSVTIVSLLYKPV